jgi:CubicO group peptidase (beta-lactamase class C family)
MNNYARLWVYCAIFWISINNASASKMLEKYNVGGYRDVPTANFHTLRKSNDFETLPTHELNTSKGAQIKTALDSYFEKYPATTGLIYLDAGKIVYEKYAGLGSEDAEFFSMSIAKSLTSLTIGKAYCAGHIENLTDKAQKYVPELGISNLGKSTIHQLLTMSSGAYISARGGQPEFKNGIGTHPTTNKPFSGAPWPVRLGQVTVEELLWGKWWDAVVGKNIAEPGAVFRYKSLDSLSLSKIIQRATGFTTAQYFEDTIWRHIKAEKNAYWEADSSNDTVASSGFQASLRDWARLGIWISNQLKSDDCFAHYLKEATRTQMALTKEQSSGFSGYGYQWWTDPRYSTGFWGVGYAGQLFGFDIANNKIILKFSYRSDKGSGFDLMRMFKQW